MPGILYEDNHLLAINKPAGWLVQGDHTGDPTLTDWGKSYLKDRYAKPGAVFLHPVHRIDRPVSGAVLFARTDKALGRLTTLFRERLVEKTYLALTLNAPNAPQGELRHFLHKEEQRNFVHAFTRPTGDAKEAVLAYAYLGKAGPWHVLSIRPLTGRPHQIRVQLATIGCPIVGDVKYGASAPLPDASIGLHSAAIAFEHPVRKEPLIIRAALPKLAIWQPVAAFLP